MEFQKLTKAEPPLSGRGGEDGGEPEQALIIHEKNSAA
jgi:hypothetical protein